MNTIDELKWRGLFKDTTNLKELEHAISNKASFYLGIDPTAESIHIGHLLTINLSRILVKNGMKAYLLIGGATASIGDPSGKSKERKMLSSSELVKNINSITNQLESLIGNFNDLNETNTFLLNNWKWYMNMDLIKFLRDYGKHINVSKMISKDNVKNRLESGISYTEFSYMMLQAYDWLNLYKEYNVKVQIGGSDQWGNIVTGTELIRKSLKKEDIAGLTIPLLVDSKGKKIGKTYEGEVVWMNENFTSSYKLYQYLFNLKDDIVFDLLKKITNISLIDFKTLEKKHMSNPKERIAQLDLSKRIFEITKPKIKLDSIINISNILFSEKYVKLTKKELQTAFSEIPSLKINKRDIKLSILELIEKYKLLNSRREIRELINSSTVKINNKIIKSEMEVISINDLLHSNFVFIRLSKKKRYLIKFI